MQMALQAAGHEGCSQGEGLYIKPTTQNEIDFYQWMIDHPGPLNEYLPELIGTLQEGTLDKQNTSPLLVMEDLCSGFDEPNILDVKLGSILWDSKASPDKQARLKKVAEETTSGSLGFRIAGMTLMEGDKRVHYGKQYGREATEANVGAKLAAFWPNKHNDCVLAVWDHVIEQLTRLRDVLAKENLEMHSVSVLILYEGNIKSLERKIVCQETDENLDESEDSDESGTGDEEEASKIVDVRLIDFAHTSPARKQDEDVLNGLGNLIRVLRQSHTEHTAVLGGNTTNLPPANTAVS